MSKKSLVDRLATAAKVAADSVRVVPVHVPGHLLHAKAYAALRPGDCAKKKGFLIVTSGNATQRGLGLDGASNFELAILSTERRELVAFERLMMDLLRHEVSEEAALKQDRFLQGLALLSSGAFYHHWQGSLGTEIRFKLTLTPAGKDARKGDDQAFPDYESDSDTISRDPLNIEAIFDRVPKPFPQAFWRTYSVDTLLGYWLPTPIASLVDEKLSGSVAPYVRAISKRASAKHLQRIAEELENL